MHKNLGSATVQQKNVGKNTWYFHESLHVFRLILRRLLSSICKSSFISKSAFKIEGRSVRESDSRDAALVPLLCGKSGFECLLIYLDFLESLLIWGFYLARDGSFCNVTWVLNFSFRETWDVYYKIQHKTPQRILYIFTLVSLHCCFS